MEIKVAVLCTIGAILGLLSVVLGFAAEATKGSQIIRDVKNDVCVYTNSSALVLGVASALALLVALIMINVAGGCFCCNRRREYSPSNSRCECNPSLVLFILSWITFVMAFLLMLLAAISSTTIYMDRLAARNYNSVDNSDCYDVKPGNFVDAAWLSLASVTLGIMYSLNIAYNYENNGSGGPWAGPTPQGGDIVMGHAQVPPTTQQSGFMYEETYTRP